MTNIRTNNSIPRCIQMRLFFVVAAFILLIGCSHPEQRARPFDPVVWQQHRTDQSRSNPRREMAVNLIQEQTLMGLSRQEVLNLLGQPIDHSPNQQADLNEQEFLYNLGQLYSGETVLLGVTFDNDQVVDTNIHTW
jgi:hypothetical protein